MNITITITDENELAALAEARVAHNQEDPRTFCATDAQYIQYLIGKTLQSYVANILNSPERRIAVAEDKVVQLIDQLELAELQPVTRLDAKNIS